MRYPRTMANKGLKKAQQCRQLKSKGDIAGAQRVGCKWVGKSSKKPGRLGDSEKLHKSSFNIIYNSLIQQLDQAYAAERDGYCAVSYNRAQNAMKLWGQLKCHAESGGAGSRAGRHNTSKTLREIHDLFDRIQKTCFR